MVIMMINIHFEMTVISFKKSDWIAKICFDGQQAQITCVFSSNLIPITCVFFFYICLIYFTSIVIDEINICLTNINVL